MDAASSVSPPAALEPPSHHIGLSDASSDQSIGESGDSFVSGHSETTRGTNSRSLSHTDDAIADGLTNVVGRWRLCVIIMLLVTATLVVATTYVFLSNSEQQEFHKSVRTVTEFNRVYRVNCRRSSPSLNASLHSRLGSV